jgi:hypothetical protein
MFQPLKGHLHGTQLTHSSSVGQQNESPVAKFNLVFIAYCVMYRVVIEFYMSATVGVYLI